MIKIDNDLLALQEVRNAINKAKEAQKILQTFTQDKIDEIVKNMATEGIAWSDWLAKSAVEETDIGIYEDKIIKNLFSSKCVYESIKSMKTVGIIGYDESKNVYSIADPVGIIAALTPTTNPTSTAIFNALIAVKSRNAIIFSPHPRAATCTCQAVEILSKAAIKAGAPEGTLGCLSNPTMDATNALIKDPNISLILATGGSGMVKAAYSSGKPAYGVGPGNVPAYIERSADINEAVDDIIVSKTFDNGTICASEQSVIVEKCNNAQVKKTFEDKGCVFLNREDTEKLEMFLFRNGTINSAIVGKSAVKIAGMAGISVPSETKILMVEPAGVGPEFPLSREKLSPILSYYIVENWQEACELSKKLLSMGGMGHSLVLHSKNNDVIIKFGLEKPASRILVNTPSSFGAIGATTRLDPSLTLGCGTMGGNITSDNIGPMHLLNIKRLAFGVKTADELKLELFGKEKIKSEIDEEIKGDESIIREIVEEVIKRLK